MLKKLFVFLLLMSTPLFSQNKDLIEKALEARGRAYAPYSKYFVGAALLTADGTIIQGCNVENASYGVTICAERAAVVSAISQGKRDLVAIAVATKDGGSPCGGCRQALNEFNPQMKVITVNEKGEVTGQTTLQNLLPNAFGPQNLD